MTAKARALDFTNVKDAGQFNTKHQAPGDYRGKVTKVADAKSKKTDEAMWVFTVQVGSGTYPYYCVLNENNIWKVRNLCVAAGLNVPKKRVNVDPNKVVGKDIGVTLEDDEYDGKIKSVVASVFPTSELEDEAPGDDEEDEGADDSSDEEDEKPAPKKSKKDKSKKTKAKKVDDVSDDDLEELEIEDI